MTIFGDQTLVRANSLPALAADAAMAQARADEYGALHSRKELLAWAQEGTYFRATNPTLGTGIAMGVQTSFSDTANALLVMQASASVVNRIIPHYIRLICTAAGASSVSSRMAVKVDTAARYSSGGTDLTGQIACANTGLATASSLAALRFGAVTAAAASAARIMANLQLKTQASPCWTVGDEVYLNFLSEMASGGIPLAGAAALSIVKDIGPVILAGLNHSLLLHMWNPSNAATPPSWEVEMAWWER